MIDLSGVPASQRRALNLIEPNKAYRTAGEILSHSAFHPAFNHDRA